MMFVTRKYTNLDCLRNFEMKDKLSIYDGCIKTFIKFTSLNALAYFLPLYRNINFTLETCIQN